MILLFHSNKHADKDTGSHWRGLWSLWWVYSIIR